MNGLQERAREQFPSVLLGVLGIIQALALELLWERGIEGIGRWRAIEAGTSGWLQVLSVFLGIVVAWVMYAVMVLRYAWVPRFSDLVFPFAIGVLEFLLVELMEPDRIAAFFALLALIFLVSASNTFSIFRSLGAEGGMPALTLGQQVQGYIPAAVAVVALLGCAALVAAGGPASGATLACLLAANLALVAQLVTFRHFWKRDFGR